MLGERAAVFGREGVLGGEGGVAFGGEDGHCGVMVVGMGW